MPDFRSTPLDYVKAKAVAAIWNGGNVSGDAYFEQGITVAGTATIGHLEVSEGANINGGLGVDTVTATGAIVGNTLESTVADGTAPIIVISDEWVENLNVDKLDDAHASATPTAATIPIADANGHLDSWITFNLPIRRAWLGA